MIRLLLAAVCVALAGVGCTGAPMRTTAIALPEAARGSPERYVVVTVRNDATPVSLRATGTPRGYVGGFAYAAGPRARALERGLAIDYGLEEAAAWPIQALGVHCIVYALPAGSDRAPMLGRLAADPRVESVQPLATFATQGGPAYNDPYANFQHSLEQMSVPQAQAWTRGDGVRLAVIDTGVDANHPDLRDRVAVRGNFVDSDEAAYLGDRHGTAVAGVISAIANNRIGIAGIAPAVQLLAYKACWRSARGTDAADCNSFTLAQAIASAIDADADVVNLSLAGPADPLLTRLVESGQRRGIIFVGAAPPDGALAGFPGDVPGVITVDAPRRAGGTSAALVAPGHDVLTLVPGAHYDFVSGSSVAAAQVSAIVALMLACRPRLDAATVERVLQRTSHPVTGPVAPFSSVDACAAVIAIQRHGSCGSRITDPGGSAPIGQQSARAGR